MNTPTHNQLAAMVTMSRTGGQHVGQTLPAPEKNAPAEDVQFRNTLTGCGPRVLERLEDEIERLQEEFIDVLFSEVEARGIKLDSRLHITISEEGELVVEGDEADTEKLQQLLAERATLTGSFRQLARLSLLAHGLDLACRAERALEDADDGDFTPALAHYHAYIKGALSHFYIR